MNEYLLTLFKRIYSSDYGYQQEIIIKNILFFEILFLQRLYVKILNVLKYYLYSP